MNHYHNSRQTSFKRIKCVEHIHLLSPHQESSTEVSDTKIRVLPEEISDTTGVWEEGRVWKDPDTRTGYTYRSYPKELEIGEQLNPVTPTRLQLLSSSTLTRK